MSGMRIVPHGPRAASRRCTALALVATLWFVAHAGAAVAQTLDPRLPCVDGRVWSMARQGDTLYVGGQFHYAGHAAGGLVAIEPTTGTQKPNWPSVAGAVSAAAADGHGGWYIGGSFAAVAGVARRYIAHLRADGSLDAWDPGLDGTVNTMRLDGSRLYVGGNFTHVGGQARAFLAAVDPVTGALLDWSPAPNGGVDDIACHRGAVFLRGGFGIVNGVGRLQVAAVDSATGALLVWHAPYVNGDHTSCIEAGDSAVFVGHRYGVDALDPVTGALLPWSPLLGNWVRTLTLRDSLLYVGGNFSALGGQMRANLAVFDARTGQLTGWNPGTDSWVTAIVPVDSLIYVGGLFATIGGRPRNGLAVLDARTGEVLPWDPAAINPTGSLLGACATSIAADGVFGPEPAKPCENLAAFDLRTGEVLDWNPSTTGLVPAVYAMAVGGGRLYVGGWFDTVGGLLRPEVASIDLSSGQVTDWRPVPNTSVSSLAVRDSTVYLAGAFTAIGGVPRAYIGAVNARTGLPTAWNPGASNWVGSIVLGDSLLFCGGDFTTIAGQVRGHAAALSLATGQATSWNPDCSYSVHEIALTPTSAWLAGQFNSVGGVPHHQIAQVDRTTGVPTAWNGSLAGTSVYALALGRSALHVGGDFWSAGGSVSNGYAAFDFASGALSTWNPAPDQQVNALRAEGDSLFIGGNFTVIAGQPRTGFARLLPTETTSPAVTVLGPLGDATLAIGTTRRLQWLASDALAVQSVDLYLSRSGPAGPWTLLAAGVANTGHWDWDVTGPEVHGTAWLLAVARNYAGRLGSAIGATPFSILSDPAAVDASGGGRASLAPPWPNPVRTSAALNYTVPDAGRVKLTLVDVQGRVVRTLFDGPRAAGRYTELLQASTLAPGLYFARLQGARTDLRRRVVVLK
jgi:hypothetical protein